MSSSEFPPGVEIEHVFLVEARYTPEAAQRRPAVRAEHLARVAELRRAGTIIESGAYSDAMTSSICSFAPTARRPRWTSLVATST